MSWLDSFKLALIRKDESVLLSLIDTLPLFHTEEEMQSALSLIIQAQELFEDKQLELKSEMQKIRKTKKYLQAAL